MLEPTTGPRGNSILERMLGAVRLDVNTYEEVEHDRSATIQALIVVVAVTIASIIGEILSGQDVELARALIIGVIRGVASWALWALATWLIGSTILKTEDTEADWGQLARGTGFAQTPGLLNFFIFIPVVGWIIALVAFLWTVACMVVAVRQSLDYTSTWRAIFVLALAFIPVIVLNTIVFIVTGGSAATS